MSFVKTKELEEIEDIKRINKARNVRRWKVLREMIGIGNAEHDFEYATPKVFSVLIKFPNYRNLCYLKKRMKTASDRWLFEFLTLGGFEGIQLYLPYKQSCHCRQGILYNCTRRRTGSM